MADEQTPAQILEELSMLDKRITIVRQNLHEPKSPERLKQNFALSCQLVKHLTRRELLKQKLPQPTLINK
jgi:hypothetical protein